MKYPLEQAWKNNITNIKARNEHSLEKKKNIFSGMQTT